jgi:hypothetical protein
MIFILVFGFPKSSSSENFRLMNMMNDMKVEGFFT